MGLDGFSMANLGLHKDITSAQMASQAEQIASKGLEIKVKDVGELAANKGVKRKGEERHSGGETFNDGFLQQQPEDEQQEAMQEEAFAKQDPKEFSVRINPKTEMIELYSNKDKRIIETISANDMMALISKMDSASGILVNKKI